jgi:predicted XRE-type DNA-binding protein
MTRERFESVWDALKDTPQEAASMRARSALMRALQKHLTDAKLTQNDAAALFGVAQPRVSDLMRGKIGLFSVDTLMDMAAKAGLHVDVRVRKTAA